MTARQWFLASVIVALLELALCLLLVPGPVHARDTTGLSSQLSPEQRDWTRALRGKDNIPCCDDADGIDPVWETHGNGYRVRYEGEWLDVEPDALLTVPNKLGVARAWIGRHNGKPFVRCFLPGSGI